MFDDIKNKNKDPRRAITDEQAKELIGDKPDLIINPEKGKESEKKEKKVKKLFSISDSSEKVIKNGVNDFKRTNRSDIVAAALLGFSKLSKEQQRTLVDEVTD